MYPLLERSDPHGGADSLGGVHVESLVHSEIEVEHVGIVLGPRELTVQLLVVVYRHLYGVDREWVSPPIEPKCYYSITSLNYTFISAQTELNLSRDRLLYEMYSGKPRPTCIRSYLTLESCRLRAVAWDDA